MQKALDLYIWLPWYTYICLTSAFSISQTCKCDWNLTSWVMLSVDRVLEMLSGNSRERISNCVQMVIFRCLCQIGMSSTEDKFRNPFHCITIYPLKFPILLQNNGQGKTLHMYWEKYYQCSVIFCLHCWKHINPDFPKTWESLVLELSFTDN